MNTVDHPDYYDEATLKAWLEAFRDTDEDVITLPGIPFSYSEICRALVRLDNIKGALED